MNTETQRIVKDLMELARIDAPSFHEGEMAQALKARLGALGLTVCEDDAGEKLGGECGNLFARWEGDPGKEAVLLSAHMDTVDPCIGKVPVLEDGVIKSSGQTVLGADDLSGVTAILEGIRRVQEKGLPHRTVEILFSIAEEVYTKGAAVFDYSRVTAKQAYCLDASGPIGNAARRAPTLLSFRITVTGKASHAGFAPEKGISAVTAAAKAAAALPQGRIDAESTRNIGLIRGGTATNIVPDSCELEGEIRSFDHGRALALLDETREVFERAAQETGAAVSIEHTVHFKAYEVGENAPVAKDFLRACEKCGTKGNLVSTLGGADNHQFNAHGIEGLVIACAMENVHSAAEYIRAEDLEKLAQLVEALVQ